MDVVIHIYMITAVVASEKQHYTCQTDIDATRNGSTGTITSPGYPGNYPHNTNCTWILKTGNLKATISFYFSEFNITKYLFTSHCEDYLQIKETEPCCYQAMHRCGHFDPFSLTVIGRIITIYFVSDNLHNTKGFRLTWKVYIPETTLISTTMITTLLWASEKRMKPSAKSMFSTRPKKLGTTDADIPTAKTGKFISTTPRTSTNKASIVRSDTWKMLVGKSEAEEIIIIPTVSIYKLKTSQVTANTTRTFLKNVLSTKSETDGNLHVTNPTARASTNRLEASQVTTNTTRKMFTILLSTTSETEENITIPTANRTSTLKLQDIFYLVTSISILEVMLTVMGIYIIIKRQTTPRHWTLIQEEIKMKTTHPYSIIHASDTNSNYECIRLERQSIRKVTQEEDNAMYIDIIEHEYDQDIIDSDHPLPSADIKIKSSYNEDDATYIDVIE